jgi:hypothetical protein
MENNRPNLLSLLKSELEFVKHGGYRRNARSPWRAPYIFEESQSCSNFFDRTRQHQCRDCWLMEFVPATLREEQVPCRYVELGNGTTVDSLYRCGTVTETEEMLTQWLQTRICELETELAGARSLVVEQRLA